MGKINFQILNRKIKVDKKISDVDSNLTVELHVTKKSCQNLVNESCNIWIKKSELDNHSFLSLEGLQLAGPTAPTLTPECWRTSRLKRLWLSSSEFISRLAI